MSSSGTLAGGRGPWVYLVLLWVTTTMFFLMVAERSRAQSGAQACEQDAITRWNRFAEDANRYARARNAGVRDVKLRARLQRELVELMRSECW